MKSKIFMLLFALPFFGVGVWMTYSIGSNFIDAWQMQGWQPVRAQLSSAGYETHSGDDSDTYEAYARYHFNYNGQVYYGDRVGLSSGADNIGDYQTDMGGRLSRAMSRGDSIVVFVNPADPTESIIDPGVRWGLVGFKSIFLLVFGGVGLGLIIFTFKAPKEKDYAAPEYRDAPWLANDEWQGTGIRSNSRATMWATLGFAALWNLISAPLPFIVYDELVEKQNYVALIGFLFPLLGLFLLVWAIRRTLEWRRFGPAPVALDPFPGAIGGHVGGTIDLRLPYDPGAKFELTLTSLHSYVSGSGDDRKRRESAKWQDSQVAQAASGASGTRLSFRFDVPENLNESDADQSQDTYNLWRLNLKAELPGTDVDRDYEIPVYATAEQSQNLAGFSPEQSKAAQAELDEAAIRKLFEISHGVKGRTMTYPMGRHLYNGIVGFLIGAFFAGAGYFLVQESHAVMGSIFGFVGGVIVLSSLYYAFNSLEIVQGATHISTVRRVLGIPVKRMQMRRDEFVKFTRKSSFQTQSGGKHVMHYTVYAHDKQGQKLVVGEGFTGASKAEAAMQLIGREFGLTPDPKPEPVEVQLDDLDFLRADM